MKVLFWMGGYFDRHTTSEHILKPIIRQLCEAGNIVHIIQKNTGGDLPSIPAELLSFNVSTDCIPFKIVDKGNFIARYLNEVKYIRRCKKYIKADYDAVFIQSTTISGLIVYEIRRKLPHAKVTINVQDIFPYNAVYCGKIKKNSIIFKLLSAIQRYGYKHSDHIVTISEDMRDTLVVDGTEAKKIEVIYNWSYQDKVYKNIDLSLVTHMFNSNYFNVVYAGNIGVMQNVEIILEVAKLLKDNKKIRFHIVGNGVYKKQLENKAKEYRLLNISFWPMQSSDLAPAIYSAADVNVIPLVKDIYRTALPSKTATCLACQKPIIFAIGKDSVFGNRVKSETGCDLVDSNDSQELANKITALMLKENKRNIISSDFFSQNMSISQNSLKYAQLITT